jgi:hypothetical protein
VVVVAEEVEVVEMTMEDNPSPDSKNRGRYEQEVLYRQEHPYRVL